MSTRKTVCSVPWGGSRGGFCSLLTLALMTLFGSGLAAAAPGTASTAAAPTAADGGAVFDRLKELTGEWRGKSTKGWENLVRIEIIADGSVVLKTSKFSHGDDTMVTLYHMDGDALVLTHYCVAKNQPRLEATAIADGGRTVTFTFRDATNLSSRDQGHMDKAVFTFVDDDHYSSQWTWYQDGAESWMEKIDYERIP